MRHKTLLKKHINFVYLSIFSLPLNVEKNGNLNQGTFKDLSIKRGQKLKYNTTFAPIFLHTIMPFDSLINRLNFLSVYQVTTLI